MSVEEELKELKEVIGKQQKSGIAKWLDVKTLIVLATMLATIVGGWYTFKAELEDLREDLTSTTTMSKNNETAIHDIQLKGVEDSSNIKHIKEKVDENGRKLEKLLDDD